MLLWWQVANKDTCSLSFFSTLSLFQNDMDRQSVLCCLHCFCWHLFEQYLAALQLLHCLKAEVLSLLPRNLQTWWDESAPATPSPADAASIHFPTPVYILFQTDLFNHICSSDRSCLHLPSCMSYTVEAETVTGYQMHKAGQTFSQLGHWPYQKLFQGREVWLHCFQGCHQCIWFWLLFLGLATRILGCLTQTWLA